MDWDQLGVLGEVAGAVGVILSMLYLSRQITENTRLTRLSTHNDTMSKFIDVMIANAQNKEISAIIIRGMQNPTDLDQAELTVFTQRIATYFMAWFNTYYQYRGGLLDLEFWQTCERDIAGIMQYPGYQYCWLELKSTFTDDFIATVDAIAASESENAPRFYPGLASS